MQRFTSLNDIVQGGFCIGCGLCQSIAPQSAIQMRPAAHGHLRPVPIGRLDKVEEDLILQLCPGINVMGPFESDGDTTHYDPIWGQNRRVSRGYAADNAVRFSASAGGVMTAINAHLLRTGKVNFILQARPDPENPYGTIPHICRTQSDLLSAKGSRYASAATLSTIMDVLALEEPFGVSLKPCDIAGVRNLQRVEPRARDFVRFTQTMFCGTVPSVSSLVGFFERRGLDFDTDRPSAFRWRGNGCPGPTVAEMPDGSVLEGTYNELWNDNPWSTQLRCKICPDAIGLQADIAVGDDWPNAVPQGEDEGWNAIIAHTEIGLDVLNACEASGEIKLFDTQVGHLSDTQPHHVRLRRSLTSRLSGCEEMGLSLPNFEGLALDACASQLSPDERKAFREGTANRLRAGDGDGDSLAEYGAQLKP